MAREALTRRQMSERLQRSMSSLRARIDRLKAARRISRRRLLSTSDAAGRSTDTSPKAKSVRPKKRIVDTEGDAFFETGSEKRVDSTVDETD